MNSSSPGGLGLAALFGDSGSGSRRLIIDSEAYSRRVLLQGRELPWSDSAAVAGHLGKAQALLESEAVLLPLDQMIRWFLGSGDGRLLEAMTAKTRRGFAVRAFLADDMVRDAAKDLAEAAGALLRVPVLIHIPSPAELLVLADRSVNGSDSATVFSDDDAEGAAVYHSDLLRVFVGTDVSGIVIDERYAQSSEESIGPVLNTAEHYRWPVLRRRQDSVECVFPGGSAEHIPVLDEAYWSEGNPTVPEGGLLFTEIADSAVPEEVLSLLRGLRS